MFPVQIPSPQPSPRLGGERESGAVSKCAPQHQTLARIGRNGCSRLNVGCWLFALAILFFGAAFPLRGQTNSETTNMPPTLSPPYDELPPTFFEQHGAVLVFAGLGVIMLAAFGGWLIFRPRPKIIIPPEVQARQALEVLREQPEDGAILSCVSQVLRNYFMTAFKLAPGELTTTEFCRAISDNEGIGAELSNATSDFLHDCDDGKFSTTANSGKLEAAKRALQLVEQAEQRRARLRQSVETQT
jgi:hypothetical protein